MPNEYAVADHFKKSSSNVADTYAVLLRAAREFGPVREDPKKTSIHLVRTTAFAGVATQKNALVLTLKSDREVASPRVRRKEQASANRWHIEVRLETPAAVDQQLRGWLKRAYGLAG